MILGLLPWWIYSPGMGKISILAGIGAFIFIMNANKK
jgi:hypothetical protein